MMVSNAEVIFWLVALAIGLVVTIGLVAYGRRVSKDYLDD